MHDHERHGMPSHVPPGGHRRWGGRVSIGGLFAFLLGVWWLLGELGKVTFSWSYVGPLALILFGLAAVFRRSWWGGCCCGWRRGEYEGPNVEPPKSQ